VVESGCERCGKIRVEILSLEKRTPGKNMLLGEYAPGIYTLPGGNLLGNLLAD